MRKLCIALLAAVLGCSDESLAPLQGDLYILTSIAGVSLPAPYFTFSLEDEGIIADTIALAANGTGTRRYVYVHPRQKTYTATSELTYTRSGDRIEINFPCRDLCDPRPHLSGTITSTGITLDESKLNTRTPMAYVRLFPPD